MGKAADLANRITQPLGGDSQRAQALVVGLCAIQQMTGQFELKFDRDQNLADAVVQFAGNP
ncbi:hypothetical protein D3C76_1829100 [compost metagenome]